MLCSSIYLYKNTLYLLNYIKLNNFYYSIFLLYNYIIIWIIKK